MILSVGPGADPSVQAVSPQVTVSHPPGGRLPLLSARSAVTSPTAEHHHPLASTGLYCLVTEHICMNNLPKVVTQRHLEQDLNSQPVDRKPKCLTRCTTAPPFYILKILIDHCRLSASAGTKHDFHSCTDNVN